MIILERSSHGRPLGVRTESPCAEPADAYVLCVALAAAGALLVGWNQHPLHHPLQLLFFALLAAAGGSQKLWVPDNPGSRVSIGYIFVMVGLLFLGVPEAMLMAAASGLAGSLLNVPERPSLREAVFNVSALVLSAALAGLTLLALGRPAGGSLIRSGILPVFGAASVYFLTNSVLAAVAVSLVDGRSVGEVWQQGVRGTLAGALAGASLAVLMALAYGLPDRTLFYLSLPLAYVLFAAYQATLERMVESRQHVEELDRSAGDLYASFHRVGQALAAPLHTAALHKLIVDLCQEMLAPQLSALCLWQEGALQLVDARFAPTFTASRHGFVADALRKAAVLALQRGQPISSFANGIQGDNSTALAFAMPLRSSEVVFGALCVLYDPAERLTETRRQLLTGFANQAALALQNARLFQREQTVADTMRHSLLPSLVAQLPGIEIGSFWEPLAFDASCIGGDYYDAFTLPDERVVACIADVCGKGMAAAVRTALIKYTVRAYAIETPSPQQVLSRTNDAVVMQEEDPESFTTLAYAVLDSRTGVFSFSSAGHPPGLLYRAATGRCLSLDAGGPALGVLPDARYQEVRGAFDPEDVLLLYTDGLIEARGGQEQFGLQRLEQALERVAGQSAQEIAISLAESVREYAGGALADDVALLVLKQIGVGTEWLKE